jgi:hypothetical protein
VRTKTLAVLLAERAWGQGQQHLLAHGVLQQKTALSIIPDFSLVFGNNVLTGLGICVSGAEDQVEVAFEGLRDGIEAAGAELLEVAFVVRADTDVLDEIAGSALLDQQVGASGDLERTALGDVRSVVNGASGERD